MGSEMLGQLLNEYDLTYEILNARPENVRRESEIVAQAGKRGSITIATNMAGRGTDIILGGNIKFQVRKRLYLLLVYYKNKANKEKTKIPSANSLIGISQKFIVILTSLINNSQFLSLLDVQ